MKYIKELTIIIFISFAGEIFNQLLPFPIPASIYGLFIMLLLLSSKILKVEQVRTVSGFLIEVMPIMFIPSVAGLINSWALISSIWLKLLVYTLVSTIAVMTVTGRTTDFVIGRGQEK